MPRQGHARCLCIVGIGQQLAETWLGSELNGKETEAWAKEMAVDCEGEIGIAQGRCVARSIHGTSQTFFGLIINISSALITGFLPPE